MTVKKVLLLILLTFVFKLGLAFYFTHLSTCHDPDNKLGYISHKADAFSYIDPVENFIKEGDFYFWNGVRKVYAGRLPHYSVPYYLLRLVFSQPTAGDLYVLVQILLDAIANVFFAWLCFSIFNRKYTFWIGYLVYLANFSPFFYTVYLAPDSLSLSFFAIFLCVYHWYWSEAKFKYAIAASILLAIVTTLRPHMVIMFLPFFFSLLVKERKLSQFDLKYVIRQMSIASLPLILLLAPWIIRNAVVLGEFIPAQENMYGGYNYTESDLAFRRFISSWGGDFVFWYPTTAGCYFYPNPPVKCTFTFPDYALADGYTINDIEKVRENYLQLQRGFSPELNQTVASDFARLTEIYKSQKPVMYHVGSRFIIVKNIFWHTNNSNIPVHPSFPCYQSYQLLFKVIQFAVYFLALTFGTLGIIKLTYKKNISLFFISIPIFLLGLLTILKMSEARYFGHGYFILLLGLVGVLYWVARKLPFSLN